MFQYVQYVETKTFILEDQIEYILNIVVMNVNLKMLT